MARQAYIATTGLFHQLGDSSTAVFEHIINGKTGLVEYVHPLNEAEKSSVAHLPETTVIIEGYTKLESLCIALISKHIEPSLLQHSKTAVLIATTKGNIDLLDSDPERSKLHVLASSLKKYFKLAEQPLIICNACISGTAAIGLAKDYIANKLYENVLVIGCDLITDFVLSGFESFKALSTTPALAFDAQRNGLSLGEAVALVLISSEKKENQIKICGSGISNDANHISGPSRTGDGLYLSIKKALEKSRVSNQQIDVISGHGTGTVYNDEMEALAINQAQLSDVPLHSLKGFLGHTLGSAGVVETILLAESMQQNMALPTYGFSELGVSKNVNVSAQSFSKEIQFGLKLSAGFGGCNAALILDKV